MRGGRADVSWAKLSRLPLLHRVGWNGDQHPGTRDSCSWGCGKAGGLSCLQRRVVVTEAEEMGGGQPRARVPMGHQPWYFSIGRLEHAASIPG
jgi:hypothetical protein